MTNEQVILLENALNIYDAFLSQESPYAMDSNSTALDALYDLRKYLSDKLGIEL